MTLNEIANNWNSVYINHKTQTYDNSIEIVENEKSAKIKRVKIDNISQAISFPTRDFCKFSLFGSLSNKNCDGAIMILNEDGTYDILLFELKSTFSTQELFDAKKQIIESRLKLMSLLNILAANEQIQIRDIRGYITSLKLNLDQRNLWSELQMKTDDKLEFGWKLYKYGCVEVPTQCDENYNRFLIPKMMNFRLLLSNKDTITLSI